MVDGCAGPVRYLTLAEVAGAVGVSETALRSAARRAAPDRPFPGPAAVIGEQEGWHPSQADEVAEWLVARPGKGWRSGREVPADRV